MHRQLRLAASSKNPRLSACLDACLLVTEDVWLEVERPPIIITLCQNLTGSPILGEGESQPSFWQISRFFWAM